MAIDGHLFNVQKQIFDAYEVLQIKWKNKRNTTLPKQFFMKYQNRWKMQNRYSLHTNTYQPTFFVWFRHFNKKWCVRLVLWAQAFPNIKSCYHNDHLFHGLIVWHYPTWNLRSTCVYIAKKNNSGNFSMENCLPFRSTWVHPWF